MNHQYEDNTPFGINKYGIKNPRMETEPNQAASPDIKLSRVAQL
jgi:hypothetical protein